MQASLSLLSPGVFALVAAAAILLSLLRGVARQVAFLALNLIFLSWFALGPLGVLVTLSFTFLGYLLIRYDNGLHIGIGVAALVILFLYMKDYAFLGLVLPSDLRTSALSTVGLSFLFFKILHVIVDARSGTIGPFDALTYVNYCTNFSTFLMGPIQRYQDYRSQWSDVTTEPTFVQQLDAVIRMLVGLVKAYVLAEWLKPYTEALTDEPASRSTPELLTGIYAFNLYLYLNFAGYCDFAIGAGSLMGIKPPENFNKPFLARNISDFWQRQHRSLTLWLTDYVFTPVFKRLLHLKSAWMTPLIAANISLMLTMVVSGLWHGTSMAFLIFGLVHGALQVVYRTWDHLLTTTLGRNRVREWRSYWWTQALAIILTFNVVSFSFVFFLLDAETAVRVLRQVLWP